MRLSPCLALVLVLALGMALPAPAVESVVGNPDVKSIEAIAFGPDGLLLLGDGRGAQVVAVETGDLNPVKWSKTEIPNIKEYLAGRLGTDTKGIEIVKLAVNPASQKVYIAVRKLQGKEDILLTLDGDGKVAEFPLEKVRHMRFALSAGDKSKVMKVTDLAWAGDRILVAAQANETFASKIFSILPKNEEAVCFSTETFHVAHNQWETKAPIRTVIPYEEGGKRYLVGAFTCTPIVKYALDEMKPGGQVKGQSVIELGSGNTPQDMFLYEKDGKTYILMNTFRMFHKQDPIGPSPYWTVRVDSNILKESQKVNEQAVRRVGAKSEQQKTSVAQVVPEFAGVMHMDRLDAGRAVVVRTNGEGVHLAVLPLP
jgi:hypothetical protein